MPEGIEKMRIPWQPGFYGAPEIQRVSNKGDLGSYREYKSPGDELTIERFLKKCKLSIKEIQAQITQAV